MYFIMNRALELKRSDDVSLGWNISKKYANHLINNINSVHIFDILNSLYGEYLCELSSHHLDRTNRMKYNRAWGTLLNTFKKYKSDKNIIHAIRQFHYTCHINI